VPPRDKSSAVRLPTSTCRKIRREVESLTGDGGMITSPVQAEHLIRDGKADRVIIARNFCRDPYGIARRLRELDRH